jgi:hypothetical protein
MLRGKRSSLQLLFPLNMFNAFVKLYNFSSLPTCPMLFVESIEHVGREGKL